MLNFIITDKNNKHDFTTYREFIKLLDIKELQEEREASVLLQDNLCTILFCEKSEDFYSIITIGDPHYGCGAITNLFFTKNNDSKNITFAILQTLLYGFFSLSLYRVKLVLPRSQGAIAQHCNLLGFKTKTINDNYVMTIDVLSHYARKLITKYDIEY